MSLPLSRPSLRRQDFDQVLDAMVHDKLSSGEITKNFCHEAAKALGLKNAFAFSSVNDAIQFLFASLGFEKGRKVILSPLTPAYWVVGLERFGLVPEFADVLPDSPVLDPESVRQLISSSVAAIIADTCLGYIPQFETLKQLGVFIIEDISHGLGGRIDGKLVGTHGDAVIASFASETLVAGSGGCLVGVRNALILDKSDIPQWELLSDLGSSLVLSQWKDTAVFAERKREHFHHLFYKLPKGYHQPKQVGHGEPVNPWFPVLVDSGAKDVLAHARKKAVEADWAFRNLPYLNAETDVNFCPNARSFLFHTVIFPLYSTFSVKELDLLGKVISSLP